MDAIDLSHWPKTLHFERGGVRRLGEFVAALGARRALVICGRTVASGDILARVRTGLGACLVAVYDGTAAHTPLATVVEAAARLRKAAADVIVSVGGGSAIDTAKAAAAMAASGGDIAPYKVMPGVAAKPLPADTVPHIAVPTVPGSGSEIGPNAGVLDGRAKFRFRDERLIPKIAVMDAEVVALCGPALTASTGLGAVARCVEALYSRHRNPLADALALHGLRLIVPALPLGITAPHDLDAREACQYAAVMSAMATANAEVSAVHAVGLVVGGRYRLAHGIAHAIVLPAALRALLPALGERRRALYAALAGRADALPTASVAGERAIERIERLTADLGAAPRLRQHGIAADDLASIAEEAAASGMMANAPRPLVAAEILQWLRSVW
jgi:alcohol dehydrogenase